MSTLTFPQFKTLVKPYDLFLILGHGSKNQFKSLPEVNKITKQILKEIKQQSPRPALLYFGDNTDKENPSIGNVFNRIHELDPTLPIFMIQIKEAESWGHPDWIPQENILWHTDYPKQAGKWGGTNTQGKPVSNTKKWFALRKQIKNIYIVGGGDITEQEYKLAQDNNIPTKVFLAERKYLGDKATKVATLQNPTDLEKYGQMFIYADKV